MSAAQGRSIMKEKEAFPPFNLLDYNLSVLKNLNWYSIEVDDLKKKKDWTLAYWKSQGKTIDEVSKMSDQYFINVGPVAHMIHARGIQLNAAEMLFCERKYAELLKRVPPPAPKKVEAPVKDSADKDFFELKKHQAEFDAGVDMFFCGKVFDAKEYLVKHSVKPAMTKQIAAGLAPLLTELKQANKGTDEYLVEAYSHLTKRQLTKFLGYVDGLASACDIAAAIIKAAKKPRATKVKSPTELVKHVQYLKEDAALKLKSEHPSKIVNASECWIYNTKTRKLYKYVALPGSKLTVKGMSILNVDVEKSAGKTIRKPEVQLVDVQTLTSSKLSKAFTAIKSTEAKVASRISEECIIIKCFN